jgi:hypothetical protein
MSVLRSLPIVLVVISLAPTCEALAQDASGGAPPATHVAPPAGNEARNSLAIVGAGTFANGAIRGVTSDRHLSLIGIRYSRLLAQTGVLTLRYTPEVVPAAWLSQPIWFDHIPLRRSTPYTHTETTYGAGASPVGFEFGFVPEGKLQPIVSTNEGFLYFSRNVPSFYAAQFNFTLEVRLGMRLRLDHARAWSFEYVYHHLSNAYMAAQNPGVDSQMLSVGYGFRLGR